jgi:hypothetical protein
VAGFAIKQYYKDRKKESGAFNGALKKKKIEKYFNYDKEGHFVKKYRSLKANAARPKESRRMPTAKVNTAEPNKYELLL